MKVTTLAMSYLSVKNVTQQYVNNIKIKYQNYIYTKAWTQDRPSGNMTEVKAMSPWYIQ